jgi:hypothetical protein
MLAFGSIPGWQSFLVLDFFRKKKIVISSFSTISDERWHIASEKHFHKMPGPLHTPMPSSSLALILKAQTIVVLINTQYTNTICPVLLPASSRRLSLP